MIITGSVLLVRPASAEAVIRRLAEFPEVTYHARSESGMELIVNFEAQSGDHLSSLCVRLQENVADIVDISHLYVNFEEEVEAVHV